MSSARNDGRNGCWDRVSSGRRLYARRKQTAAPVFGVIKGVMGFRQFPLCWLEKVRGDWELVWPAYNVKRLWVLQVV